MNLLWDSFCLVIIKGVGMRLFTYIKKLVRLFAFFLKFYDHRLSHNYSIWQTMSDEEKMVSSCENKRRSITVYYIS